MFYQDENIFSHWLTNDDRVSEDIDPYQSHYHLFHKIIFPLEIMIDNNI